MALPQWVASGSADTDVPVFFGDRLACARTLLAVDIDGVLLDSERGGDGFWQTTLHERFGISSDDLVARFFEPHWPAIVIGREALLPALAEVLAELDDSLDPVEFVRHWFDTDFVMNLDVVQLVASWARRGVPVLLVTNQEPLRAAYLWQHLGPAVGASAMAYSGGLGVTKDDPDFFRRTMDVLDIDQDSRVVFVDDAAANVTSANEAGWAAVLYADSAEWRDVVDSFLGDGEDERPVAVES